MSKIQQKQPPVREDVTARRPLMPLDKKILDLARARAMRPVNIAKGLDLAEFPGITTQRVVSRLKALVGRGYMERIRPPGGPANGPGTSFYRTLPDKETPKP